MAFKKIILEDDNGGITINKNTDGVSGILSIQNNQTASSGSTNEAVQMLFGLAGTTDAGVIRVGKDEDFTSTGAQSSFMSFYTKADGTTSEVMRFRKHIGLGIKTTNPGATLHLDDGNETELRFSFSNGNYLHKITNNFDAGTVANNKMRFYISDGSTTGNNEVLTLTGNQRVGINENSPDKKLHIKSSTSLDGIKIEQTGVGGSMVTFFADGQERGFIGVDDSNGGGLLSSTSGLDYVTVIRSNQEIHFGTNNNNTAMVIDNNQNIGVGLINPSDYYSDELVIGAAHNGGLTIANTDTSHSAYIMWADGTSGDAAYRCQVGYSHDLDRFGIWTAATNALFIDSNQDATFANDVILGGNISGGSDGNNIKFNQNSSQLYFLQLTRSTTSLTTVGNVEIGGDLDVSHTSDTNKTRLKIVGGTKGFTLGKTGQGQSYAHLRPISDGQVMAMRLMPHTSDQDTYLELWGHDYETDTTNFARGMLILKQSDANAFQIVSDANGSESVGPIEFVIENGEEPSLSIESNKTFLGKNLNGQTSTTELGGFGVLSTNGSRYGNYGWLTFNAPTTNFTASSRGYALTNAYQASKFAILKSSNASTEPSLTTNGELGSGTTASLVIDNVGNTELGANLSVNGNLLSLAKDIGGNASYVRMNYNMPNSTDDAYGTVGMQRTSSTTYLGMLISSDSRDGIRFNTANGTPVERMRITETGLVGINVDNPTKRLEVDGSFNLGSNAFINYNATYPYTINMENTAGVGNLTIQTGTGSTGFKSKIELQGGNTATDASITLTAADNPRMTILNNGMIGINTTSATDYLHVVGAIKAQDGSSSVDYVRMYHDGTDGHFVSNRGALKLGSQGDEDALTVDSSGNATFSGDLDVTGSINSDEPVIAPTYATFVHSFTDDMGTVGHYIPWNSSAETTGNDFSATSFVAPMNMTLKRLYIRIETISNIGSHDLTVSLITKPDGSISNTTVATSTKSLNAASSGRNQKFTDSQFSNPPNVSRGQMCSIKLKFGSDIGNSTDFFITSVWEMDNSTL